MARTERQLLLPATAEQPVLPPDVVSAAAQAMGALLRQIVDPRDASGAVQAPGKEAPHDRRA